MRDTQPNQNKKKCPEEGNGDVYQPNTHKTTQQSKPCQAVTPAIRCQVQQQEERKKERKKERRKEGKKKKKKEKICGVRVEKPTLVGEEK